MSDHPKTADAINAQVCGKVEIKMNPFKDWSKSDVDSFNAKSVKRWTEPPKGPPVDRESELHDAITQYCREHGWSYIHSRMDRRTTTAAGVCDFVIFADMGRTFCVECKRKGGKLSPQQQAFAAHLSRLGHKSHTVYSMAEFLEAVKHHTQARD